MKIIIEVVIFLFLFTLMVRLAAGNNGINVLYFYPRDFQEKAYELHLADRKNVRRERRFFMIIFLSVLTATLVVFIHINKPQSFIQAYWQVLFFLEIMNWYFGIVIDRIWVGNSPLWIIPGMEGVPYLQSWKQVLNKRIRLSIIWVFLAPVVVGLVMLTGGIK
ncbi:MAG: hypothetical protein IJG59_10245 [Erysipelotrichaceae bacterium]|nr:hypothetical protein [Erysipelotrichaceae bacterium]